MKDLETMKTVVEEIIDSDIHLMDDTFCIAVMYGIKEYKHSNSNLNII